LGLPEKKKLHSLKKHLAGETFHVSFLISGTRLISNGRELAGRVGIVKLPIEMMKN
jgi:hypothetical protein